MFEGEQGAQLQVSLKEFLERPENRPRVEAAQKREVRQALGMQQRARSLEFRERVLALEPEAQRALGPFLKYRVLRRIVQCLSNGGDLSKWAGNARVLAMLGQAQAVLDSGRMSEEEVEDMLLRHLKDPSNPHHDEFEAKTRQTVRVNTDQLVHALNEHLAERRKGNAAYGAKRFSEALAHYERALAVVELVEAINPADAEEIDANKVAVLLNIAAVRVEEKSFGAAVEMCTRALQLDPKNAKGLLRRARAHAGRHDCGAARRDLSAALELDPWDFEARDMLERLERVEGREVSEEKAVCRNMISPKSEG
eukprot:evm.model.scf_4361.2 EVM.evm.TU.scf_4361.2   scf_4361:2653-7237(-)